jgi:putative membrane protein
LAADRTIFAAERTYAAWVPTGLASLAAGVGAKAALGEIIPVTIVVKGALDFSMKMGFL